MTNLELKAIIKVAFRNAIDEVGVEVFKKTSLFPLTNKRREFVGKIAA